MNDPGARAAAALVAIVVYANALVNGFALDAVAIVQQNVRVHQLSDQAGIWLTPYWPMYGEELGLYRPLAIFVFALQWAAGNGAAWVFHATSIALHTGVSLLVFQLLRVLTGGTPAALAGALVFAVHPVHVEAVATIVGQAELLAAAALAAAVLITATRPGSAISWPRRLALCALFLFGALAKESIIVLPALLVAVDTAQGRLRARGGALRYARDLAVPLFLLMATVTVVILVRIEVLGSAISGDVAPGLPFLRGDHRVLVALQAVPEFFRLLLVPIDLSSDYSPAVIVPVTTVTPAVISGAVLLLALIAAALLLPIAPAIGLPAAWLFLTILPVSNLLYPIGVVVAERLLYSPSIATAIVAAHGWKYLVVRTRARSRGPAYAVAAVIIIAFAARSLVRNADWKAPSTVLGALVRDHPESYSAQFSLAQALLATDPAAARRYLDLAYRTWPDDPFLLSQIGRLELAAKNHTAAVQLLERARAGAWFVHETESSLAYGYLGLNRPVEALRALDRAERLGADQVTLLALRALAYERMGRLADASGAWRAAARADSTGTQYWRLLARSLARGGWTHAALAAVDTARQHARPADLNPLSALEQAIRAGCYHVDAESRTFPGLPGDPCRDPLEGAMLVLPGQTPPPPRATR